MKDRELFNNYMAMLGEIFDKEFTGVLVETYWKVLLNVPDDRGKVAFERALATCKFFPKPAELLELAGVSFKVRQLEVENNAQNQAHLILDIIRGRKLSCDITDPVTKYLILGRFVIPELKETLMEKDNKWFVRDFCEAYTMCSELDHAGLLQIGNRTCDIKQLE